MSCLQVDVIIFVEYKYFPGEMNIQSWSLQRRWRQLWNRLQLKVIIWKIWK